LDTVDKVNKLRLEWVTRAIALFFIIGILLSFDLWLSSRVFPLTPIFNFLKIKYPFDLALVICLLVLLGVNLFITNRKIILCTVAVLVVTLMFDQMRWQPWVYIYLLLLLPFTFIDYRRKGFLILTCHQIIFSGIYFWSGVHKLNSNFVEYVFKDILSKVFGAESQLFSVLILMGYLLPLIEILVSIALIFPRTRNLGVYLGMGVHFLILICFSPLGVNENSIILPWNAAMMVLITLIFYKNDQKIFVHHNQTSEVRITKLVTVLLVWFCPLLNVFNYWDHYLSFSLYSGKINHFYIAIEDSELPKLNERHKKYFAEINGLKGGKIIDVQKWALLELNVPFTGQSRVFRNICKPFCSLDISNDALIFLEIEPDHRNTNTLTCSTLIGD